MTESKKLKRTHRRLLEELAEIVVDMLTEFPDDAEILIDYDDPMHPILRILPVDSDMGKLIGREAVTIKAINTIVRAWGAKENQAIHFEIGPRRNAPIRKVPSIKDAV